MPLRMGVRSVGALGLSGCDLSRESLEAIGSLAAIAIERANTVEKLTRSEAARESDRLRSVLLDSVTHEFRTPLTAIKASAETLAQISVSFWQAGDAAHAREVLETARALFPKNSLLEATEKNLNHKLAR